MKLTGRKLSIRLAEIGARYKKFLRREAQARKRDVKFKRDLRFPCYTPQYLYLSKECDPMDWSASRSEGGR